MSTAFMNALKSKSATIQKEREEKHNNRPVARVSDPAIAAWLDPRGDLQKAGLMTVARPRVVQEDPNNNEVTNVHLVAGKNRIDVFFKGKPQESIRNHMKMNNWAFNGDRVCWYHADTEENREFLRSFFKIEVPVKDPPPVAVASELPEVFEDQPVAAEIPNQPDGDNYNRYKQQCRELMEELKIDAADLGLLAIDYLHKFQFGRN